MLIYWFKASAYAKALFFFSVLFHLGERWIANLGDCFAKSEKSNWKKVYQRLSLFFNDFYFKWSQIQPTFYMTHEYFVVFIMTRVAVLMCDGEE